MKNIYIIAMGSLNFIYYTKGLALSTLFSAQASLEGDESGLLRVYLAFSWRFFTKDLGIDRDSGSCAQSLVFFLLFFFGVFFLPSYRCFPIWSGFYGCRKKKVPCHFVATSFFSFRIS